MAHTTFLIVLAYTCSNILRIFHYFKFYSVLSFNLENNNMENYNCWDECEREEEFDEKSRVFQLNQLILL